METTLVRPRNKTADPQLVEADAAVSVLRQVRNDERAWEVEKERRDRELAAANVRALEIQDQFDQLKQARADWQKKKSRHLSGQAFLNDRIAVLEGEMQHLWSAGGEPRDHALELVWRRELLKDVPKWLTEADEQIAKLDAEIAAFEKKHVLK